MKNRHEGSDPEIFEDLGQISHIEGFTPLVDEGVEPLAMPSSVAPKPNPFDKLRRHPKLTLTGIGALAMGAGLVSRGALAHSHHH